MNGSNVWGSSVSYGDVPPLVQMEYLKAKEYFPFKTVIIDDSLQITLVEKNQLKSVWFHYLYGYCSKLHGS